LAGGDISWTSKKPPKVAFSTTKAEYMATIHVVKEAFIGFTSYSKTLDFSNKYSCISLSRNPTFHACTKHVEIQE
jgi:hypothetical protein